MPKQEIHEYINDFKQINHFIDENKHISKFTNEDKSVFRSKIDAALSFDRTSIDTIIWGQLLSNGYTLKQVLNPKDDKEAEQINQAVEAERRKFQLLLAGTNQGDQISQERFNKYASEAFINVINASEEYVNNEILSKNLQYDNLSFKGKNDFLFIVYLCHDASQEIGKLKSAVGEKYKQMVNGDKDPAQYYEQLSSVSFNIDNMIWPLTFIQDKETGISGLYANTSDRAPAEQAEFDKDALLNSILPNLIAKSILEEEISKNHTKSISEIDTGEIYRNNITPANIAVFGLDKDTIDHVQEIMLDPKRKEVFLSELMGAEKNDIFIKDPETGNIDLQPFKTFVNRVYEDPERFRAEQLENSVKKQLITVADKVLVSERREADVKNLSQNDKIKMVMDMGIIANGSGKTFGQDFNSANPNAEADVKINNYVKELYTACVNKNETYVYLPEGGKGAFYRLQNGYDVTLGSEPVKVWNPLKKGNLIDEIEKLKAQLDAQGTTRRDSDEIKNLRTTLSKSLETLKSTMDIRVKDTCLNNIAEAADKYYVAKLDQSQNGRRNARFNVASILRNVNKAGFDGKLNMKQNVLEKAALLYAKNIAKTGNERQKAMAKSILQPYNRENLAKLAGKLGEKPNIKGMVEGKSNEELKAVFFGYAKTPEAKAVQKDNGITL